MDLSVFESNNDFCENDKEITKDEFIIKAKKILNQLGKDFSSSHKQPLAPIELIPESKCEECTGENTFIRDGKECECVQGEEDCFERFIDYEELYNDILEIAYGEKSELIKIMSSNIVDKHPITEKRKCKS